MKIAYEIFEEELMVERERIYTSYGVRHVPTGYSISDVTLDREKLFGFVKLINMSDLEVVHFQDVVEDYLEELQ